MPNALQVPSKLYSMLLPERKFIFTCEAFMSVSSIIFEQHQLLERIVVDPVTTLFRSSFLVAIEHLYRSLSLSILFSTEAMRASPFIYIQIATGHYLLTIHFVYRCELFGHLREQISQFNF